MTIELRKGHQSINILNVYIMKNCEDKLILNPMPTPNEADAKPMHVYIDSSHILSTFELTIDRTDVPTMKIYID